VAYARGSQAHFGGLAEVRILELRWRCYGGGEVFGLSWLGGYGRNVAKYAGTLRMAEWEWGVGRCVGFWMEAVEAKGECGGAFEGMLVGREGWEGGWREITIGGRGCGGMEGETMR